MILIYTHFIILAWFKIRLCLKCVLLLSFQSFPNNILSFHISNITEIKANVVCIIHTDSYMKCVEEYNSAILSRVLPF